MDVKGVLRDAARKQGFVTPMFEHIAPRYDAFTRAFSFGMDAVWKQALVSWAAGAAPPSPDVVDLACGTGDLGFLFSARVPNANVVGIDAAAGMIARARARGVSAVGRFAFSVGDLAVTGLPTAGADVVFAGYAFRNIPRLADGLAEAARVLRRGGSLYVLDFYRPASALWRRLYLGYLRVAGSAVGWWWHRAPVMYAYIADSIDAYVDVEAFETAASRCGLGVTRRDVFFGGGVALHALVKR